MGQEGGESLLGRYALHRLHSFTVGEVLTGGRQDVLTPDRFDSAMSALVAGAGAGADEAIAQFDDLVLREDLRDLTRIREVGPCEPV